MTTFADSETRMRRMLRDPNGDIWTSMDLQTYFNDAQVEIAQKTNLLIRVESHYYPPRYDFTYLYDWEQEYLSGDYIRALEVNQGSGGVIAYPWEAGGTLDYQSTPDDGSRVTQSWEAHYCNPADPPGILLHAKMDKMKFLAYDQEKIEPIDEKRLRDTDRWYRTKTGQVSHYWRPDEYSNQIYLYPRPSSFTVQEPDVTDTFDDAGGINPIAEIWLDDSDYGIVTDVVDIDGSLFAVYIAQPEDIAETTDKSSFPDFLVKYIEYATLERAYGADTDGFIPSLRDYWKTRKEIGLKSLAMFCRLTLSDRDYRLGGQPKPTSSKRLRLPEGYPAI